MDHDNKKFAVIAECKNYDRPLYLYNLTFSRLIDDVVVPYDSGEYFFIDGVSLKKEELKKIKIIQQSEFFERLLVELHHFLRATRASGKSVSTQDYPIRFDAIFREGGEDVTLR